MAGNLFLDMVELYVLCMKGFVVFMKKLTGLKCILFIICIVASICMELVLSFFIEPVLYGASMQGWSLIQNIFHWILTCAIWGIVAYSIVCLSKKRYGFDIMKNTCKLNMYQYCLVFFVIILSLVSSYIDWDGFKVVKEFNHNGLIKFIFQYIYYSFEVMLMTLVLIFGQKAFELWFKRERVPYGGIILAFTWGAAHFITKGFFTGILCIVISFVFGIIYLVVKGDVRKLYPILWVMFIL